MRARWIALGLALWMGGTAKAALACSQCMCGTPFPADALGGVVPMQFRFGIEERYLSKSNALEDEDGSEREREHRVSGFGLWRPTDRLALIGRLPYNVKEITETPTGEASASERTSGLGDAEALAMVGLARPGGTGTLGLVLGVIAPTGSNDLSKDGERLDAHLQSGTGAWSGTAGLNVVLPLSRGNFEASVLGRWNGANRHDYRYGDVALYNLGYSSPARNGWQLLAQLNGRSASRDRLEDGELGADTGGTVVYASPGLRWLGPSGIGLEAAVQIPILESLYGEQDEHTTGRLSVSLGQ